MQSIAGAQVHREIEALIDRADRFVVLVSPFVRPWEALNRAIARAVARGVDVQLLTRRGRGGPSERELWVWRDLDQEVSYIPDLHLKAYLSEKEAMHTSANLVFDARERAVESSMRFDRSEDGWQHVAEVWQKTEDEATRSRYRAEVDLMAQLTAPDFLVDGYCLQCGAAIHGEHPTCLQCRAGAIADHLHAHEVTGRHCVDCGTPWSTSFDRPRCRPCFDAYNALNRRTMPTWFVHGEAHNIQAWMNQPARSTGVRTDEEHASKAILARTFLWLGEPKSLRVELVALGGEPFPLPLIPLLGQGRERAFERLVSAVNHLTVERLPRTMLPTHPEIQDMNFETGRYVSIRASNAPPIWSHWDAEAPLATWDLPLVGVEAGHTGPRPWFWPAFLGPRQGFTAEELPEPGRATLGVRLELTAPAAERARWHEVAEAVIEVMLASLHRFEPEEVYAMFGGKGTDTGAKIAKMLAIPAPMGPISLTDADGRKLESLPGRRDRVVAFQVHLHEGEAWHLRGWIAKVKKAMTH